jgi:hypothetical protein
LNSQVPDDFDHNGCDPDVVPVSAVLASGVSMNGAPRNIQRKTAPTFPRRTNGLEVAASIWSAIAARGSDPRPEKLISVAGRLGLPSDYTKATQALERCCLASSASRW